MTDEARFAEFDASHPEVWALFQCFTLGLIAAGKKHHSSDAVLHRVRWETDAGNKSGDYKINNNWSAFYARKFHKKFPRHAGFFRTRSSRADGCLDHIPQDPADERLARRFQEPSV
jgi:hypothetical protein